MVQAWHPLFLEAKRIEFSSLHFTLFRLCFLRSVLHSIRNSQTGVARSAARGFCNPSACKYALVCLRFYGICQLWFVDIPLSSDIIDRANTRGEIFWHMMVMVSSNSSEL